MCGSDPFTPKGEAWGCDFPPNCGLLCLRAGSWQGCVSASPACFSVRFFLFWPVYLSHSARFWVPFRGNCSVGSCRFGMLRLLLCCHLEPACCIFNVSGRGYSMRSQHTFAGPSHAPISLTCIHVINWCACQNCKEVFPWSPTSCCAHTFSSLLWSDFASVIRSQIQWYKRDYLSGLDLRWSLKRDGWPLLTRDSQSGKDFSWGRGLLIAEFEGSLGCRWPGGAEWPPDENSLADTLILAL